LDYSTLNERIELFREVFTASLDQTIAEFEMKTNDHASRMREEVRRSESTKETIERQREELRKLDQSEWTVLFFFSQKGPWYPLTLCL
jgi:hypothetical protein